MGFWVQVAEWAPSPKEDLLGKLPDCREGDVRGPPGWVLPEPLVLLPGDCRLPVGPDNALWAWAGDVVPWMPL